MPTGAELQTALYYPLNLIFAFLSPMKGMTLFIILHIFLSSFFMYLYLREVGTSKLPSLFGGLAFTYNGYYLMHVDQLSILSVSCWLPLIFLLIEKTSKDRNILYPALAALVVGAQFLAGHPQISAIMGFAAGFYVIYKLIDPFRKKDFTEVRRLAVSAGAIALAGLLIASISLLPFYESFTHSMRSVGSAEESSSIYVSPGELQTFLVPELRLKGAEVRFFGGTGETYAGVVPLALAVFAAIFVRSSLSYFYVFLGIFSVLTALGKAFPLHYILYWIVPVYRMLQIPIRFMFLYTFSVSVLSAMALERIGDEAGKYLRWLSGFLSVCAAVFLIAIASPETRAFLIDATEGGLRAPFIFLVILASLVLLLFLFARKKINSNALILSLAAIMLLDLLYFGARYFSFGDEEVLTRRPPALEFLQQDRDVFRASIGVESFGPNLPMVYGIQSIAGYSPVIMMDFMRYVLFDATARINLEGVYMGSRYYIPPDRDSKMLGLLNVKYRVFPFAKDGRYYVGIKALVNHYPRAFIVPRYSVIPDRARILIALRSEEFDPEKTILLENDPELSGYNFRPETRGVAEIVSYSTDRIDIRTSAEGDSMLFLSELHYPGWGAYVDGRETEIHRANFMFRSVPLRAGEHEVAFVYDCFPFKAGKYLSLMSLLLCVGLVCISSRVRI